ncbi:MAG: hypothetical protein ACPGYT_02940 [Nitrospirales bacterium]
MGRNMLSVMGIVVCTTFVSCANPQFFTVTIYDSPSQNVRLQAMSLEERDRYSHPVSISKEQMTEVLKGLYVEVDTSTLSPPFWDDSENNVRRRAFSDGEIQFFAPLFVKGLQEATPEEIITFFETAEISDMHEATTSGGVYVRNDTLHIILSNDNVQTPIWQDNAEYHAPYRLAPLEPIAPEPGRLVFVPTKLMVPVQSKGWLASLKGKPWQAAVSYKKL